MRWARSPDHPAGRSHFQGSGFYVTDNRQGSSATLGPAKGSGETEKKETVSSEPETKTETKTPTEAKADASA